MVYNVFIEHLIQGEDIMKTMKILYKTILMILLIIMCTSNMCYAEQELPDTHDGGGTTTESDSTGGIGSGLPDLDSGYAPTVQMGDSFKGRISTVLGVLTILGVIGTAVGLALIGLGTILGSASEKAANQEKYVGIVIAAILITGASVIAKFIISFAENII